MAGIWGYIRYTKPWITRVAQQPNYSVLTPRCNFQQLLARDLKHTGPQVRRVTLLAGRSLNRNTPKIPLIVIRNQGGRAHKEYMKAQSERNKAFMYYVVAAGLGTLALSYAAVPLYKMFCQVSGYAGTTKQETDGEKIAEMEPIDNRVLSIKFNADTSATMRWNFKPVQKEIKVVSSSVVVSQVSFVDPGGAWRNCPRFLHCY
eukprot:m.58739 g.58739  ORF g.58739 m.58739 type:complete len:203 (-) comp11194_c0_seq8:502-1110(-)